MRDRRRDARASEEMDGVGTQGGRRGKSGSCVVGGRAVWSVVDSRGTPEERPRWTLRLLDLECVASLGFVPEPLHLPSIHLLSGSNEQASADFILHPVELRLTPFWNAPDEL